MPQTGGAGKQLRVWNTIDFVIAGGKLIANPFQKRLALNS